MALLFYIPTQTEESIGGIDEYTKLMLHMDGDFGSTGHNIESYGVPVFDNTTTKFGSSVNLDGTDYLIVPNSDDWHFGSGNITYDFWMRPSDITGIRVLISQYQSATENMSIYFINGEMFFEDKTGGSTSGRQIRTNTSVLSLNTWHHIAVVKNGGTAKIYVDGVEKATGSFSAGTNFTAPLTIGSQPALAYPFGGHMDEIRISNIARWTSDFSSNLPTEAYTSDANTKLLLHTDGDVSDSEHNVSMTGDPNFDNTTYKFSPSSLYFDGTGDYISITDHDDFNLGTGQFTIDFWLRFADTSGTRILFEQGTTAPYWQAFWDGSNTNIVFYSNSGAETVHYEFPLSAATGVWYHIAFVRGTSGDFWGFIDGDDITPNIIANMSTKSIANPTSDFTIGGRLGGTLSLNGYIDEFRISKGVARWTSNFTPPTGPYTE
jgi:hypothetical protein